ncbi:uncharacterized protein LOC143857045 [Tasmannia lanceolata]|uniref:uncharacterized protein LOC143857045 n=1 Tax=Tasmannia lanceolata TaxID=3420 RepID=UPI0040635471
MRAKEVGEWREIFLGEKHEDIIPRALEQGASSTGHVPTPVIRIGLPVDTNLETSFRDTYQVPPRPLHMGCQQNFPGETSGSKVDDPALGRQQKFPGETSGSKVDPTLGRQQNFPGETSGSKVDDPALGHEQNFPGETSGSKVDDPALGRQQNFPGETSGSKVDEPAQEADSQPTGETVSGMKSLKEFLEEEGWTKSEAGSSSVAGTSKLPEIEPEKLEQPINEEDVCPTCLEEYTEDKPRITARCGHHFHHACILAWKKKSETCPICDQEMVFNHPSQMGDS